MSDIEFPPTEELLPFSVVGDVHGRLSTLQHAVSRTLRVGLSTLIQVGDFWLYDDQRALDKLDRMVASLAGNKGLSPGEFQIIFADGNHENFDVLDPDADGPVRMSESLTYVPRGIALDVEGVRVGFFGGAESVDREHRTPGFDWWPQERVTYGQYLRAAQMGPVDVLITHDTSLEVYAALAQRSGHAAGKVEFGRSEREMISDLLSDLGPDWHVHGHHHTFGVFDHGDRTRTVALASDFQPGMGAVLPRKGQTLYPFDGRMGQSSARLPMDPIPV